MFTMVRRELICMTYGRNMPITFEGKLFQKPGITYVTSQPSTTIATALGSFGGILNLWIGITFFALIELVELIYNVTLVIIQHRKNSGNRCTPGTVTHK